MNFIDNHIACSFEKFVKSWNNPASAELNKYFSEYRKRIGLDNSNVQHRPYWVYLPCWLFTSVKRNKKLTNNDKKFIKDISWAQYSIFLAVRMHDDLFDGHSNYNSLIYAGDHLMNESGRIFSIYFPGSSVFWRYYHNLIEITIHSIVEVENLQSSNKTSHAKLLPYYQNVCSIFKIGTLAVCCKSNIIELYEKYSRLLDKLAIIGHMIDDLKDIKEDFNSKRFNSAFLYLIEKGNVNIPIEKMNEDLIEKLYLENRHLLLNAIHKKILSVNNVAEKLGRPEIKKYLLSALLFLEEIESNSRTILS